MGFIPEIGLSIEMAMVERLRQGEELAPSEYEFLEARGVVFAPHPIDLIEDPLPSVSDKNTPTTNN